MAIANYTLAVDRRIRRDNEQTADFIRCTSFGKAAEFAEKYLKQGTNVLITGRITTGSYTDKDGRKVYTTSVIAEDQEFAESKKTQRENAEVTAETTEKHTECPPDADGFMKIPEGIQEELPFS